MSQKSMQQVDDFMTLTKTISVDLPITGLQWIWGFGKEETVTKVAWKGYDAGARLSAAAIDNLYRLPLTAALLKSTAPTFLRWRRVSNAVTGAVFASLWQTIGLPTAGETQALREAVNQLSADLRAQQQNSEALVSLATRIAQALEAEPSLTPLSDHNGFGWNKPPFSLETPPAARPQGN